MRHLAVIMDGNGRYAVERGLERNAGHRAGAAAFARCVKDLAGLPIEYLSAFAFSADNNKRPADEVAGIYSAICDCLESDVYPTARERGMAIRFIGDLSSLSRRVSDVLSAAPNPADPFKTVIVALNYGGLDEIVRAARKIRGAATASAFRANLDTAGIPDPDALIRYGGHKRLSGYMPIQTAYAELFFTDKRWPEYDARDFESVISEYAGTVRNFGGSRA